MRHFTAVWMLVVIFHQLFASTLGNIVENELELVCIRFTDNSHTNIPMFAFSMLFSLPIKYHCSTIKIDSRNESSAQIKVFVVQCEKKRI